ncbi:MAG: hypothetical protein GX102_14695 [Porphyromonadaceae bacterium]|jgi:hypothetical protein|nr:hypothetical protein [Porphyromonadaceae bacterium]
MATITTTIFIGQSHPNHGGISPTHIILLTENSRPSLTLRSMEGDQKPITIIPTIENMVDDIYLMIAVYVLKKIKTRKELYNEKNESLYEIFDEDSRKSMYRQVMTDLQKLNMKIVFNLLDGSNLIHQIEKIKQYPVDFEITKPFIVREYSPWQNKVIQREFN